MIPISLMTSSHVDSLIADPKLVPHSDSSFDYPGVVGTRDLVVERDNKRHLTFVILAGRISYCL